MLVQPIDWFLAVWFVIAALCTAYVAYDQFKGNPEPAVMKWGFVLITLYMGPIGLLLYVMSDKEPKPGTHEAFVSAPRVRVPLPRLCNCARSFNLQSEP